MKPKQTGFLKGVEKVILALPKRGLRKKTARKLHVLEQTLQTCAIERKRAEKHHLTELAHLYGASQFCLICEADITVFLCEMMCADHRWTKSLFARHLALTLLEGAEDVPQILGKTFRDALNTIISDQSYLSQLNAISRSISQFRHKHEKKLRMIRNFVAAHHDLEARNQLQIIENLDVMTIKLLATEFSDLLLDFTRLMTTLLMEFTIPNMLNGRVNIKPMIRAISDNK